MILTLTPNASLDRLMFIDQFLPGGTMRPSKVRNCVGGKGLNAAMMLTTLGVETLALSFIGGDTGRHLMRLLDGYGVKHELLWLEGETRIYNTLVEQAQARQSNLVVGELPVTLEAAQDFISRYQRLLSQAKWVIAAGSLPPGLPVTFYRTLVEMAQTAKVPLLLDSRGEPALATLPLKPSIFKMNWAEFNQTFKTKAETLVALHQQAQLIYEREQLSCFVITCGEHGLLAFTPEGTYHAFSPPQKALNAAGAGDAASAALAWRCAEGDSWTQTLHWAAAVSAATVLTECTGESHRIDIDRLYSQVMVRDWS